MGGNSNSGSSSGGESTYDRKQQAGVKKGSTFQTYKGGKAVGVDYALKDKIESQKLEKFHNAGKVDEIKTPITAINIIGNATLGWTNAGSVKTREYFTNKVLSSTKAKKNIGYTQSEFKNLTSAKQEEVYDSYMSNRMSGKTDAYGNTHPNYTKEKDGTFRKTGGGDNQTRKTEAQILQENTEAETKKDDVAISEDEYKKRRGLIGSRSMFSRSGGRGFFDSTGSAII
jgi:hypothetical protein